MARQAAKKRGMRAAPQEIDQLREIEKQSFAVRSRLRERPYLQAVYKLYRDWRKDGHSESSSKQIAKMWGISLRKDSHPIRIIIDCSSPETDEKMRSRWTLALRHAHAEHIEPPNLDKFFSEEGAGGLAGRAGAFEARQRKAAAAKKRTAKK
jgi:hypothetical protein